jgi:hypothetical protein
MYLADKLQLNCLFLRGISTEDDRHPYEVFLILNFFKQMYDEVEVVPCVVGLVSVLLEAVGPFVELAFGEAADIKADSPLMILQFLISLSAVSINTALSLSYVSPDI